MKSALRTLIGFVLFAAFVPFVQTESKCPSGYQWVRAIKTGVKTWPRWIVPVNRADQKLIMVTKESTWSSVDGVSWTTKPNNASVAVRPGVAQAFFKNRLWLLGGMNDWSNFSNEIWSSSDGLAWTRVVDKAPWEPRRNALVAVFNDRLWLFSGAESSGLPNVTPTRSYRDAWQSEDGVTWKRLSTTIPESEEQIVVFENQLWLLGKAGAWSSIDGLTWTQRSLGAPFTDRRAYGAVVYNDRIWLLGGMRGERMTNEVWSTHDGNTWVREANASWFPRGGGYSVAFDNKLWIYGGKTGTHYKQADDVWYMTNQL